MKTIRKNVFATEGYMFSFIAVTGFEKIRCTLCIICAVMIALSCIPAASVPVSAVSEKYLEQSLELYPDEKNNEKYITLNGVMPENASAEVVDVTEQYSGNFRPVTNTGGNTDETSVLAAYDISITGKKGDFQPIKDNPILIEIVDPKIFSSRVAGLWHITDDGRYEQVNNFTVKDGKISFYAEGFSVYAIVDVPEPYLFPDPEQVTSADALTGSRAAAGFCLLTGSVSAPSYISSALNNNHAFIQTADISEAAVWYFENTANGYELYTYVNGVKKYLHTPQADKRFAELNSTAADLLEITPNAADNSFILKNSGNMYLQYSNSGKGIRYYDKNENNNTHIKIFYADTFRYPDDVYGLNGKTYGLMRYSGGTLGYGLMSDTENNSVDMTSLVVRTERGSKILYVAQDCDIAMWTFHSVRENMYTLSANVNGVTKYISFSGDHIALTDDIQNAAPLSLISNGSNIMLSCQDKSIVFDGSSFSLADTDMKDSNQWLSLTKMSGLADNDYVCYSADKTSVSEVAGKTMVIVYTRVWNDEKKRYDFYAVDHDGTLYPCYERGDNIMWVGNRINTMQWEFIEYQYDDGSPKYYYELYNPYSRKYIAPQLKDGQVLSDHKIGIDMPGRREGEYYTDIIAWDDLYYSYAGLKSDDENGRIISAPRSKAETYYFAVVEKATPTLTKIDTIDNNEFGIKMKMIDFPDATDQNAILGTTDTNYKTFATKGLLSTQLNENGYPTTIEGRDFSELYNGENGGNHLTEVNHLFIESIYKESGYFEFDSCQNFATLYNENGDLTSNFTVYKELGTTENSSKTTLQHGQFFPYDIITPTEYSKENPENLYGAVAVPGQAGIGLLSDDDPRKYERLHTVGKNPNYHNGMEMEANFIQTPDGKDNWGHDIIFEFTGDDDFWLYVDNELVIDLGGIHSALAGSVNFSTGDVWVEKNHYTLREIFESNYQKRNPTATQAEIDAYLAEYFKDGENIFKDHSAHTMKLFYMERGAGASNLHMRFNLSHSSPSKVMLTKQVSGADDMDFHLVKYPFQIWYKDEKDEIHLLKNTDSVSNVTYQDSTHKVGYTSDYTPPDSTAHYESVYFLNPGMSANINFPEKTTEYRMIECGINTDVYDSVHVNGANITGTSVDGNTSRRSFDSGWQSIKSRPSVVFDNHMKPNALRTLSFKKVLYDQSGHELTAEDDPTAFSFRLSLSKNSEDTPTLANMYQYHVTNPEGYLCKWDIDSQTFASVGIKIADISALTASEKESVTFDTSMNGAISKIPAGYTVHVPNLPVGTKFIVTERDYEIPLGYKLISYEKVGDSYFAAEGSPENMGQVTENNSPSMLIKNQRGCGMEAQKIWTDTLYAASHDPVYTAVYYKNELVAGTVRQISHPDTSVRYYFDSLRAGTELNDYSIYEVKIENPVLAPDGETVTGYDSITRLNDQDKIKVGIVSKRGISDTFSYTVRYDEQTHDNMKTNTITNVREGGIVLTLYDMYTREPLANGVFVFRQGDTELATFTSDSDGRIAVIYDFTHNIDYTITEITPPSGYIGLPNSATFSIDDNGNVTLSGNESQWQSWKNLNDGITAYIDFFNKPYTLRVTKVDGLTHQPLSNAHFALYRGVQGIGGYVKDTSPIIGFSDLVTDSDGIVPLSDGILPPGRYYLTETAPPEDYQPLDTDIIFTISGSGNFVIDSAEHESFLSVEGTDSITYSLTVPNTPPAKLTVTKTVKGNFGSIGQEFTFTLTVENASAEDEYAWSKNGISQAVKLRSGGTFTLKHNDTCTISLPRGKNVTISENSENYTASFRLGTAAAEAVNEKTFVLDSDITLAVTNTLDGILPTGIKMHIPVFLLIMVGSAAAAAILSHHKKESEEA